LKLNCRSTEFIQWIQPKKVLGSQTLPIDFVSIDTRNLIGTEHGCFIALVGIFRSGLQFIEAAYQQNVRVFILTESPSIQHADAVYLIVDDPIKALQSIASVHRSRVDFPILAIAGKNGKTTVKEWLYELIKSSCHVVRSPKSYNSKIGVPLSLLELSSEANVGIFEVAFSSPQELETLFDLINPTHFLVTNFFHDEASDRALRELLHRVRHAFIGEPCATCAPEVLLLNEEFARPELDFFAFNDPVSIKAAAIAVGISKHLDVSFEHIREHVSTLQRLALRMESFNGKNNTLVLNDTYNLDIDAFKYSLAYWATLDRGRPHGIYVGLDADSLDKKGQLETLIEPYHPDFLAIGDPSELPTTIPENSVILLKGTRKANMEKFAALLREKQHQTTLEINLSALRNNVVTFKKLLHPKVKLLAMVKAQSYGSGLEKLAEFLEAQGIDYLGVAYTSEGVALRKHGIKAPILVLNPDPHSYADCIAYALEPTIFTFHQADLFIRTLIEQDTRQYPIHIEVDTGMRRLGFEPSEIKALLELCQAQPEIYIKGVFSHFVESDQREKRDYSLSQIGRFKEVIAEVKQQVTHELLCHLANSEGIVNYPEAHFNMVRLGLGMFGLTNSRIKDQLQPVLAWKSVVSQIKRVNKGESVSYSRSFIAVQDMKIAIIPLGYGDGYSRTLSNGIGELRIHGIWCPIVGLVCMDMIMVDVSAISDLKEGDEIVVFDDIESLEALAHQMNTIPYEVMTGISERVHRVYFTE
jgi:alanine racemase